MYLLSGSVAYDTVLLHEGEFQKRILPKALSRLNVSFGVDSVENEFGGTAGNIAYNSALLGQFPCLCTNVGKEDFSEYAKHFASLGIKEIKVINPFHGTSLPALTIIFSLDDKSTCSLEILLSSSPSMVRYPGVLSKAPKLLSIVTSTPT